MANSSAETIQKRMVNGYDRFFYESMWRDINFCFGDVLTEASISMLHGRKFPDYPDIRPSFKEIGTSNRIFSTQFITLAKVLRSALQPEFPDVDKYTAEVRKQAFLRRADGTGGADGELSGQIANAFLDGDGVGSGFIQLGAKTNKSTGQQFCHFRHVPALQMLWDRNERSFSRAQWCAAMHYMRPEDAESRWGKMAVKDHIVQMRENNTEEAIWVVRVFEYYDLGIGKEDPTMSYTFGDIDQPPHEIDGNTFGENLPFAHFEHLLRTGMRRPTGRISQLRGNAKALNEFERRVRADMRRPGFDEFDPNAYDTEQIKMIHDGEPAVMLERTKPVEKGEEGFIRHPGGELSETTLKYGDMIDRNFTRDSGVNDFDSGLQSEKDRTLGENQLLDARSKSQSNWTVFQTSQFLRRLVEKAVMVMTKIDTDPLVVPVFGRNVNLNVPGQPASQLSKWMTEYSRVVVSEESLLQGDLQQERIQKMQVLNIYAPLVEMGVVDPIWWGEQLLEAGGYDPKEAMPKAAQAGQQQMQGQQFAQPGQELVGQPPPNGITVPGQ